MSCGVLAVVSPGMARGRQLTGNQRAFIRDARVAHLATADAENQPHVVPICFAFDAGALYSVIDEKPKRTAPLALKRVRNIAANPHVAVVIDRYDENWSRLAYVLLSGRARLLRRGAVHRAALVLLRRKYPQYRSMALEKRPIIRVSNLRASVWGAF